MMSKTGKKQLAGIILAAALLCTGCGNQTATEQTKESGQSVADVDREQTTQAETNASEQAEETAKQDGMAEYLEKLAETEKQSAQLKDSIDHDDLNQVEYNAKTGELYQLWDQSLNDLWKVLESVCAQDQLETLRDAQADWITERDRKIKDAGMEVEGGSMQPMLENMEGAKLTEARVHELMGYLPGYEEAPVPEEADGEESSRLDAFLKNEAEMTVADQFVQESTMLEGDFQPGKAFKLDDIKEMIGKNEGIAQTEPVVSYAALGSAKTKAFAVRLQYDTEAENMTQFLILSEQDGSLKLCFAIDGWSRRYPGINKYGVVFDGGSNGAGSHSGAVYVPDSSFVYHKLIEWDENYYGYDFYDEQGKAAEAVNAIMKEAGDGNETAMGVAYTRAVIDGKEYYYYLGSDGITQETVDYIDGIAAAHDFTFDGKDKVDQAESDYAEKLGVGEIYSDQTMAEWKDLN